MQIDITEIPKADGMIRGVYGNMDSGAHFWHFLGEFTIWRGPLKRVTGEPKTLSAADPSLPRIDVIAVDSNEHIIVIEGTPAVNPQKPSVDPETQIERTYTLVPRPGATVPGNIITDEVIFAMGKTGRPRGQ